MLLQAALGLEVVAHDHSVRFSHARLPQFLEDLRIENLPVGGARIDLHLVRQRTGVGLNILARTGDVEVMMLK
jgi:hypothetical protein